MMTDRELDMIVAEKVMSGEFDVPHYSTSIEEAMHVVARVAIPDPARWPEFELVLSGGNVRVRFYDDTWVEAETAPRAICLAALRHVGVEVL